jgi:hypothetical protein
LCPQVIELHACVDERGQLMIEAHDSTIASGRYGVAMYKTAAR